MMEMNYEKAEGNYSAYCPGISGCTATGQTMGETVVRVREAIGFCLEGLKREGLTVLKLPRTIFSIVAFVVILLNMRT